jgi:hypothetical protein
MLASSPLDACGPPILHWTCTAWTSIFGSALSSAYANDGHNYIVQYMGCKEHYDTWCCTGVFSQIPRRKCAFYLATFVLRGAWANWHHSRSGYNLDELTNQLEPTRNLASHIRNKASQESLLELWWCLWSTAQPCQARNVMVPNNKDNLFKVRIGLVELMRGGITIRCLWWPKRAEGLTMTFKRAQGGSKVTPTQFRIQDINL